METLFGNRLKVLRENRRVTQKEVSNKLGIARSTYAKYETGQSQPDHEMLQKLADYYETSIDHLIGRRNPYVADKISMMKKFSSSLRDIKTDLIFLPFLGSIRAGEPIEMIRETASEYVSVESDLIGKHDGFVLEVKGNSMSGDQIYDGDRVVVIYTPDFSPSDICVVAIDGKEATLKRVKCQKEVCILSPSNSEMEPMVYAAKDVFVIGVVVEVRRRLKR